MLCLYIGSESSAAIEELGGSYDRDYIGVILG